MRTYFEGLAENSYLFRFLVWLFIHNLVDLAAILLPVRLRSSPKRRVVFTRLDSIGDYLIWTSTFDLIEAIYPSSHFELLLIGNSSSVDLADKPSIFDEKIYVNRKRLVVDLYYRFRMMRLIRSINANIIINPTLSRDFMWSDSIVRCSAALVKIGSRGLRNRMVPLQQWLCDSWYTQMIASPLDGQHELISNDEFMRELSPLRIEKRSIQRPKIHGLEKKALSAHKPFAFFFLGAQFAYKCWPVERFAKVAEFVSETYGLDIVIEAGPGKEALGEEFDQCFARPFVNLVGKTSLTEMAGMIASSSLVVTNDTSVCHIGAGLGIPTVVINSGAHGERFFPYPVEAISTPLPQVSVVHKMPCFGCDWNCVYSELTRDEPKPCITGVSVEQATDAIRTILAGENSDTQMVS
jgi:ADP-heptose:LPS heptosyltransferase